MTLSTYSDNSPDVFTPARRADTDSWAMVVADVVALANRIAATEFVPKGVRGNVPATAAAMLYGREVGLPPMTALSSIHVVEGRPGMSAEAMRALVFAAGHEIVFDEATGAICKMRARRSGSSEWTALAWSIDMARAAGLDRKDNWRKYPRAMLIARCSTDLCRMVFPDVVHGLRSTEEIVDMTPSEDVPVAPGEVGRRVMRSVRRGQLSQDAARQLGGLPPVEDTDLPEPPPLPEDETADDIADPVEETGDDPDAGTRSDPLPAEGPEDGDDTATAPPSSGDTGPGPRLANRAVVRMILIRFARLGFDGDAGDRDERLDLIGGIIGRPIGSANQLTAAEGETVLSTISTVTNANDLRALVDAFTTNEDEVDGEVVDEADTPLPDPPEDES